MKLRLCALFSALLTASSLAVTERTANNGNLVMQDVPEIPQTIVEALNRYQNVRSAPFREFSQDGESIYVSTRFGDVSQLHRVDKPGGARHQLTFFDEPIGSISRQPDGDLIAFSMDAGGSEYAQIFVLDPQTGESKMLTDGESRNGVINWSNQGGKIAYQSTKRNGRSNDIWVMDANEPEASRLLLESPDGSWWGVSDWNEKDTSLLVQQYISASDSRIYTLDLDSGERQLMDGGTEQPSVNYSLEFARDDKGYFLTTNQGSEFERLAYRDFGSGELTIITEEINWNVGQFALSEDGKRAAFSVNQDGISQLYLLDTKNFKYRAVDNLPVGLVGGLTFSDDGRQLALTLNTAQTPSDSFILELKRSALRHGDLTRWTYSEVGGLNTDKFSVPELVRFESFDKRQVPAFVYKPNKKGPQIGRAHV